MLSSAGDPKVPSSPSSTPRRNQQRGRGSALKGESRKSWGMCGISVVFFTALLPSLVAGQSITCDSNGYVKSGEAKFNGLADGVATFTEEVRLTLPFPPLHSFSFFS